MSTQELSVSIPKFLCEVALAVLIGIKSLDIGSGVGINFAGVVSNIAFFGAVALAGLSTLAFIDMCRGVERKEKTKDVLAMTRNGVSLFVLLNVAFQLSRSDEVHRKSGDADEDRDQLRFIMDLGALIIAVIQKVVLDPATDLSGYKSLIDVNCEATNRQSRRVAVLASLSAALVLFLLDIGNKSGSDMDKLKALDAEDLFTQLSISIISLVGLHILLLLLGIVGQASGAGVLKLCALGGKVRAVQGEAEDCENSSFHGLNELPLVRSVVVSSVVALLGAILALDVDAGLNVDLLATSVFGVMVADQIGRNVA